MDSYMALWMFLAVFVVLLSGNKPIVTTVAPTIPVLAAISIPTIVTAMPNPPGTEANNSDMASLMFAALGLQLDTFDADFLTALPNRLFGIMNNETLIAVPLFVFMGVMLERAKIQTNPRPIPFQVRKCPSLIVPADRQKK
jgi:hypothetical protein